MSAASDLQDRRRTAVSKVKRAMVEFLIEDDRFDELSVESVKMIAAQAETYAWNALVEMTA